MAESRVEQWKRRLLDLSLRNPLLNARDCSPSFSSAQCESAVWLLGKDGEDIHRCSRRTGRRCAVQGGTSRERDLQTIEGTLPSRPILVQ